MKPLEEIFRKWKGRTVHKWTHYFDIYERHLAHLRGKPITLIEIGLGEGGSVGMWREYFGRRARIVGIDVNPACEAFRDKGFEIFIGDQSDPAFLRDVLDRIPQPDVVIDDGGHTARQQINSFETLFPRLTNSGTYIVEDTHTSYWSDFKDCPEGRTWMEYAKGLCDELNAWHFDMQHFKRFATPVTERPGELEVPWITRHTRSISFYDSVVVLERAVVGEPWHRRRP